MGLIHKAELSYIDSLKKKLQLKANLQWIHFPLSQTPNTFYQTKELFKWSPAPKGIFLMAKSTCTQYLFHYKWTRSCIILPKQGNHREAMLILMHGTFYPHSWSCFACLCCTLDGISQCIPLRHLNRHNRPKAVAKAVAHVTWMWKVSPKFTSTIKK